MPVFLNEREPRLRENMDDPNCDLTLLNNTYEQFATVNRLLSGWHSMYENYIRPAFLRQPNNASLLDIGCGGGDILRMMSTLAKKDNLEVNFKGIDPDLRAIDFARQQNRDPRTSYLQQSSSELSARGESYSVVISNHLLHHLNSEELLNVCKDAEDLATDLILFSDIERSDLGYASFRLIAPIFFKDSFIAKDGALSIRKSYRATELQSRLPDGWKVKRKFPYRLLAILDKR